MSVFLAVSSHSPKKSGAPETHLWGGNTMQVVSGHWVEDPELGESVFVLDGIIGAQDGNSSPFTAIFIGPRTRV